MGEDEVMKNLNLTLSILITTLSMGSAFAGKERFRSPKFIPLKATTVQIGSPDSELTRNVNERLRTIMINQDFEIQETEVTQHQWFSVMKNNPSGDIYSCKSVEIEATRLCANRPVNKVSWNDVQAFIKRLNAKNDGYTYRLPTEAEWEYAARGGSKTAFSFGALVKKDDFDGSIYGYTAKSVNGYAWYAENSNADSSEVANLKPNQFGLYDMHGNVREWVAKALKNKEPTPIMRGGAWDDLIQDLRSARREFKRADESESNLGFRLVRTPR